MKEASESFDSFLTEMRRLVKPCDYGALEESILKDRIVMGVREDSTRRKLLQIRKLDLAGATDVCRSSETVACQLKEFIGVEDVNKVTGPKNRATNYQPQRSKSRVRNEWKFSADTRQKSCK